MTEADEARAIPLVEETLRINISKCLVLREELRIIMRRTTEHVTEPVALRSTHAVVEREDASDIPDHFPTTAGDSR